MLVERDRWQRNQNARLSGVIGTTGTDSLRVHSYNYGSTVGYVLSVDANGCGGSASVSARQRWFTDVHG